MRVMLKFEPLEGKAKQLLLDDVALIGWETEEQAKNVTAPNRRTHVMVR